MAAALQSSYVQAARKISFNCSRAVTKVYDAVCMCSGRSTSVVILNYLFTHATLGHLVDSVKPRGKLINTVVEIGIYVINGKKTRGATRWVMPLHITVLFPVLQKLVQNDEHSGHYFLIVVNLRNNRFEILDSMRTLENEALAQCSATIINTIKKLWETHYAETSKQIEDYEIVQIGVPKQANNCDYGRLVCNFQDICNMRKILTHTWLNFEENDVNWESILNLA
ncbi:hypothetical protein PAHAL_9G269200 [Panicum hallii]|uniref:Ubiquitin-like protease family profile domain-containing protein n=1 Tax=Panicum hallii TaxID=206008 RepID=A0A2T8I2Q2_9POAL|nr:hypothetical protein PAHAL_9G269200 [Panicum hallii]